MLKRVYILLQFFHGVLKVNKKSVVNIAFDFEFLAARAVTHEMRTDGGGGESRPIRLRCVCWEGDSERMYSLFCRYSGIVITFNNI